MNKLITIAIILLSISVNAQTVYLVVVDYPNGGIKVNKTKSIEVVNKSFENHFKQSYDIGKDLVGDNVMQHRANGITFYVEKKRINKKGKYRKIKK